MAKRGNYEGSIYRRKDGRWTASAFVNGRRRSFYGRTREEAAGKLTDALAADRLGRPLPGERLRVGTYLGQWLELKKSTLRPLTFAGYAGIVKNHVVPELGKVVLSRLTVDQVQAMLNKKAATGLSPRQVEYIRAVLRAALSDAIATDKVTRNVAIHARPPRQRHREMKTLSAKQAQQLLAAAKDERLGALYVLAVLTGMRQGELLALAWRDVDFEGKTITVNKTLQRVDGEYVTCEPKSDRSRRVLPLPDAGAAQLRAHRAAQLEERLRLGTYWQGSNLVFTNATGGPLHGTTVTHTFQAFLERAGLPRIRFHDLRHTTATLMLTQGLDSRVIMEQLGHSQFSLTMNTYAHVMPHKLQQAADTMDGLLRVGN